MTEQNNTCYALSLVLPNNLQDVVNTVRKEHDRAFLRWKSHCNILFPFMPEEKFKTYRDKLVEALKSVKKFDINLNTIGYFSQGKGNITMHLKPDKDDDLQNLYKVIMTVFNDIEVKKQFSPHLSIGQFKKTDAEVKTAEYTELFKDKIKYTIDEIHYLKRDPNTDDKMYIIDTIKLGE